MIDYGLEKMEPEFNIQYFFILSKKWIDVFMLFYEMDASSLSKLKMVLRLLNEDSIIVNREKIYDFKEWFL